MIINLRGCNGSGKTTLARSLLNPETVTEVVLGGVKCTTDAAAEVVLIGPYIGRKTGGCDCLPDFDTVRRTVSAAALLYQHVVFEGVVLSTVYSSWATFDDARGRDIVWAFLSTIPQVCLARIYVRNGGKPIKEELVLSKHRSILKVREKATADGRCVRELAGDRSDTARLQRWTQA